MPTDIQKLPASRCNIRQDLLPNLRFEIDVAHPTSLKSIPSAISHSQRIGKLPKESASQIIVAVNAAHSCRSQHTSYPRAFFQYDSLHTHTCRLHSCTDSARTTTDYKHIRAHLRRTRNKSRKRQQDKYPLHTKRFMIQIWQYFKIF